jgi:hypothetical protein
MCDRARSEIAMARQDRGISPRMRAEAPLFGAPPRGKWSAAPDLRTALEKFSKYFFG